MSTVSMQLNGKVSSTVNKSIDSCHSKEYIENISLTSLTLSTLGAEPYGKAQEKIRVPWCACAEVVNLWVWLPFRFVSRFISFLDYYHPSGSRFTVPVLLKSWIVLRTVSSEQLYRSCIPGLHCTIQGFAESLQHPSAECWSSSCVWLIIKWLWTRCYFLHRHIIR